MAIATPFAYGYCNPQCCGRCNEMIKHAVALCQQELERLGHPNTWDGKLSHHAQVLLALENDKNNSKLCVDIYAIVSDRAYAYTTVDGTKGTPFSVHNTAHFVAIPNRNIDMPGPYPGTDLCEYQYVDLGDHAVIARIWR